MPKYKLCFTGMDRGEEASLKVLFVESNTRLGQPFELAPEAEADLLVVDVDSIYGHMTWLKTHGSGKTVVALSSRIVNEADHSLVRPVTEAALHALLERLATGVDAAPAAEADAMEMPAAADAGEAADAEPPAVEAMADGDEEAAGPTPAPVIEQPVEMAAAPEAAPAALAEPPEASPDELQLIDFLRAGALPGPARLDLPGVPPLLVDPARQVYAGPAQVKALIPHTTASVRAADWTPIAADAVDAAGTPQPLARLVWLCALTGGRPVDAGDTRRFKLAKWPQIEREFPKHFRIATAMMKGPATLAEIAEASGAGVAEVADFVNASLTTGFAEVDAPAGEAEAAKGGLLGRFKGLRGA